MNARRFYLLEQPSRHSLVVQLLMLVGSSQHGGGERKRQKDSFEEDHVEQYYRDAIERP